MPGLLEGACGLSVVVSMQPPVLTGLLDLGSFPASRGCEENGREAWEHLRPTRSVGGCLGARSQPCWNLGFKTDTGRRRKTEEDWKEIEKMGSRPPPIQDGFPKRNSLFTPVPLVGCPRTPRRLPQIQ